MHGAADCIQAQVRKYLDSLVSFTTSSVRKSNNCIAYCSSKAPTDLMNAIEVSAAAMFTQTNAVAKFEILLGWMNSGFLLLSQPQHQI